MRSLCRDCGASIIWCVSENGRRAPVNADPVTDGNVFIYLQDGEPIAQVLTKEKRARAVELGTQLRTSHFATCPNAQARRRR